MRTATVLLSMMLGLSPSQGRHRKNLLSERIGVCTGVSNADAVKRAGGHHIELGLSDFANPEKDDARFADDLQRALACGLPTCSTNGFCRRPSRTSFLSAGISLPFFILSYTYISSERTKS